MAYVIWRVVMKKYSNIRLGLNGSRVTPVAHPALPYAADSWKPAEEEVLQREGETRQSKTKRVKNYLKRCKKALGSGKGGAVEEPSSWYLDEIIKTGQIGELEEVYEDAQVDPALGDLSGLERHVSAYCDEEEFEDAVSGTGDDSSLALGDQGAEDGPRSHHETASNRGDLGKLVAKYFGPLYENFLHTEQCLIRQARDLLVCEYHGCLHRFETEFCMKASKLLQHVKEFSPAAWPLCLGAKAISVHLGTLDASLVRNGDCYLCVTSAERTELALIWRDTTTIRTHRIAELMVDEHLTKMCSNLRCIGDVELAAYDDYDGVELPELLRSLLVSVERVVQRVPLDDLATPFPCAHCVGGAPRRHLGVQTSPMFEFAGSIPHIDSDEDDERDSIKSGSSSRKMEIARPKRITDLPEKLLMSGINLPGTADIDGKPIILCYAECIARAGLNKYEIAKLLLYYSSIPSVSTCGNEFTVLLLAENESDNKIADILDKSTQLIANQFRVHQFLIWCPKSNLKTLQLPSRNQATVLGDESALFRFVEKAETPSSCGAGKSNHDQLEWVEFFRQVEPFHAACKLAGRSLVAALAQIRSDDVPQQATRKSLSHQCRQITQALELEDVQKVRHDAEKTLTSLKERSQWLNASRDVKRNVSFAYSSYHLIDKVTKRLEQLKNDKEARLKELERYHTLKKEADSLIAWISGEEGEKMLNSLTIRLRTVLDSNQLKEATNSFEKFFFTAWKKNEKSNELHEETKEISDPLAQPLKESIAALQASMKTFREQLEATREELEHSARCFLADKAAADELAAKTELLALKDAAKTDDFATSTPVRAQERRRHSVSSLAYVYRCEHHANAEYCSCYESDPENSVSYKLKKKYMQAGCACSREPVERKNSATLGGIKEESVENLLERCDSGLSHSLGEESVSSGRKVVVLQRTCSCQFYRESCALCGSGSGSSTGRSATEEGSETFGKNINDLDDFSEEIRKVPPISVNSHLYCHASTLDLPADALYANLDPKKQKTLNFIYREMVETERDYVKSVDYVIVNYIPELSREDIPQALRGQRNIIFGNIEKIYEFHSHHFLRDLEHCENDPLQVGQIFTKHDKQFYLYALYNKNKPKSDSLMSEYGTSFFKTKQIELEDRMDLASYLLKPVQRMGKYALLLQQMMKVCSSNSNEKNQQFRELKQAEEMVRFKLRHGNDLLAMDSIRECDVNLKEQGRLLRQNEFMVWEGRTGKKSPRQVFLFEELILFSKARRFPDRKNLDLYYYKNSMKMADIGLTQRIGESCNKFEIWFRKQKPNDTFTLESASEEVRKAWEDEIYKLLSEQAIRIKKLRNAEMSSMGIGNNKIDIQPSADQIKDRSISVDQISRTAPRFRNSIAGPGTDTCRTTKRPYSVISMSSVSSGSTSSGGSGNLNSGQMNLSFDTPCDSPKPYHRSATLNSQCSTESGIVADMSVGSDEFSEQNNTGL